MKKIKNIVFYKFFSERGEEKKACIFYEDGSVEDTDYDKGIDACEIIAKERKITSKNAFKEMINKDIVHVVSGREFSDNFHKYVSKNYINQKEIGEVVDESMQNVKAQNPIKTPSVITPQSTSITAAEVKNSEVEDNELEEEKDAKAINIKAAANENEDDYEDEFADEFDDDFEDEFDD